MALKRRSKMQGPYSSIGAAKQNKRETDTFCLAEAEPFQS
jgi:hypothetical protein